MAPLIHCCWFGGPKPAKVALCVESWKRFAPECRILEWNEDNCGCEDGEYYRRAVAARRWAFAADYVRLRKLEEYGGLYLDTDMELTAPAACELLSRPLTLGFEKNCVHAGVIGAGAPHHPLLRRLLDGYGSDIDIGAGDREPRTIVTRLTDLLIDEYGLMSPFGEQILAGGVRILPANRLLVDMHDGANLAIHHYEASWKRGFDAASFVRDVERYCDWRNAPLLFRLKESAKMFLQYRMPRTYRGVRDGRRR